MLLKIWGMVLIILSSGMFGWSYSRDYELRIIQLREFQKILMLLKGEINYHNAGIREAILIVSKQNETIMGEFLREILKNFAKEVPLKEAWYTASDSFLRNHTKLKKQEISIVKELGTNLGITDRNTQIHNIMGYMEVLELSIRELEHDRIGKCKMYKTLGVMGGAFVAVIFL